MKASTIFKPIGAGVSPRRHMLVQTGAMLTLGVLGVSFLPARVSAQITSTKRVALVIGNAHYHGAQLKRAVDDARQVWAAVSELGFEASLLLDATQAQMQQAITSWVASSPDATARFFYFAGHGAQYRGRNYLIPVDAQLRSEDDLTRVAIDVNDFADRLSRFPSGVNLVVLDSCRNVLQTVAWIGPVKRGSHPGFLAMKAPKGTLIAFSTAPGALANDKSLYTTHLVTNLREPGLPIEAVFKRTRAAVERATQGKQIPWESSSLTGEFCLSVGPGGLCGSAGR